MNQKNSILTFFLFELLDIFGSKENKPSNSGLQVHGKFQKFKTRGKISIMQRNPDHTDIFLSCGKKNELREKFELHEKIELKRSFILKENNILNSGFFGYFIIVGNYFSIKVFFPNYRINKNRGEEPP